MGTHKKRHKLPQGRNRQEAEIAAELTAPSHTVSRDSARQAVYPSDLSEGAQALGIVALLFAAASWMIWPFLLGATAATTGYIAYRQGSRTLGIAAIAMSLISMLAHLILIPLYFAFT